MKKKSKIYSIIKRPKQIISVEFDKDITESYWWKLQMSVLSDKLKIIYGSLKLKGMRISVPLSSTLQ